MSQTADACRPLPRSAAEFHDRRQSLVRRFDRSQPELALTVSDAALGLEGYVVVWNTRISQNGPLKGIAKGGTRCIATLDLPQVARLARTMAIKNAAAGLPLGGAKSGVRMDRDDPNYERKWRRFVELTSPILHERGGPFGGYGYDVGCRIPDNASWAVDELQSKGLGTGRSFTGKPVELGGTDYDNEGIAGLGVAVAARTALAEHVAASAAPPRFAVQGIGAMGAGVCRYFSEFGGRLAAVSDPLLGGTWSLDGNPLAPLLQALAQRRLVDVQALLQQSGRKISDDPTDVLFADVDVVFPAATEDVVTAANAAKIRAPLMVEGANNPTSSEAYAILFERRITVVPDVIANPGGIIAAFVEMTTPTTPEVIRSRAKVDTAKSLTIEKVSTNTRRLLRDASRLSVQPNHLAYCFALETIVGHEC